MVSRNGSKLTPYYAVVVCRALPMQEGKERLNDPRKNGNSSYAFSFKNVFPALKGELRFSLDSSNPNDRLCNLIITKFILKGGTKK